MNGVERPRSGPPLWAAPGGAAAFTLVLLLTGDAAELGALLSNLGLLVVALAAAGAARRAARRTSGRVASCWRLLGWSAFAWACGMAVWTWIESVLREQPVPSLADVGYLASIPLTLAALLRLPWASPGAAGRARALADGVLIGVSTLLISWVLVLRRVVEAQTDDLLLRVVALAYPLGDVLVITLVLHVLLRHRDWGAAPVPVAVIGAGLLSVAVADSAFAYLQLEEAYTSGNLVDGFWFLGFALLAAAGLRQPPGAEPLERRGADSEPGEEADRGQDADQREAGGLGTGRPLGLFVPYAPVLLAVAVTAVDIARTGVPDPVVSWMRTVLFVALVVRQVLALRENLDLTSHLERRVAERTAELSASRARFEALVQHSHDVTTILDRDGVVTYQSASGARLFGHGEEVVGLRYAELADPADVPALQRVLAEVAAEPLRALPLALRLRLASGGTCDVEATVTNLLHEPSVAGFVLNTRDVSERQALERRLVHEATHDSLTGLANRSLFESRVAAALAHSQGAVGSVAVVFLDLDGFKAVNDSLGHDAGDQLLCQVAARLRTCVRGSDLVARLGGDEFAVLLEGLEGEAGAVELTERLSARVRHTVVLEGREIAVRGSVGVAVSRGTEEPGELLRNADLAMYRAKAAREGGHAVFDPAMHADLVERLDLEAELRQALRDVATRPGHRRPGRAGPPVLDVHYQPVVELASGELVAVEALARWTDPVRGPVPPSVFVPIAEECGLVQELGRFVLLEACTQAQRWRDQLPDRPFSVTVNISGRQLTRDDVVTEISDVLDATGLPAQALVLEMTESVLLEHADGVLERLVRIKDLGVRLAVDDFGTGYSSLSYLHQFPMDVLKIDRTFVGRLGLATADDALVPTIVSLADAMGLTAVAEGVENARQVLALRRLGCQFGQGFHFAPPVPAHRFLEVATDLSRGPAVA